MVFPNNISKEHILKAIDKVDHEGIPSDADSQYYDVVLNGRRYPPKVLVSYANIFANGSELDRKLFSGGVGTQCFKLLQSEGFVIEEKVSNHKIVDVKIYEVKTGSAENADKLLSPDQKRFYWNDAKFRSSDLGDYVFVVNRHAGWALFTKLDVKDIFTRQEKTSNTSTFNHDNNTYTVSDPDGVYSVFVRFDIVQKGSMPREWNWGRPIGQSETYDLRRKGKEGDKERLGKIDDLEEMFPDGPAAVILKECRDFLSGGNSEGLMPQIQNRIIDFSSLVRGKGYDRPTLAKMWGYKSHTAISRGVFTPVGENHIILFITKSKQDSLTQYEDRIEKDELYWEGERKHGNDLRITSMNNTIHVFYREKHHTPFTYLGLAQLLSYQINSDRPSKFKFRLIDQSNTVTRVQPNSGSTKSQPSKKHVSGIAPGELRSRFIKSFEGVKTFRCEFDNPFLISIGTSQFCVFIKNLSPAYFRNSPDITRIQVPFNHLFTEVAKKSIPIFIFGYDAHSDTIVAWNPDRNRQRVNTSTNISIYSRGSIQQKLRLGRFIEFYLNSGEKIIAFNRRSTFLFLRNYKNLFAKDFSQVKTRALVKRKQKPNGTTVLKPGKLKFISDVKVARKVEKYLRNHNLIDASIYCAEHYKDKFPEMSLSDWTRIIKKMVDGKELILI